jgi:hypothetical protein
MAKSIYTPDEIVAAGEALEQRNGTVVEPWEVYKALGERGKFDRIKTVWEEHLAARRVTPSARAEAQLPSHAEAELMRALDRMRTSMQGLLSEQIAQLTAEHVEQVRILQRQHAEELARIHAQLEYWRERALEEQQNGCVSPPTGSGAFEPLVSPILRKRQFPARPMGPSCKLILPNGGSHRPAE